MRCHRRRATPRRWRETGGPAGGTTGDRHWPAAALRPGWPRRQRRPQPAIWSTHGSGHSHFPVDPWRSRPCRSPCQWGRLPSSELPLPTELINFDFIDDWVRSPRLTVGVYVCFEAVEIRPKHHSEPTTRDWRRLNFRVGWIGTGHVHGDVANLELED